MVGHTELPKVGLVCQNTQKVYPRGHSNMNMIHYMYTRDVLGVNTYAWDEYSKP